MRTSRPHSLRCVWFAVALAGCASTGGAWYQIGSVDQRYSSSDAPKAFAEAVAGATTQGKLDGPLKMLSSPMPAYPPSWRNANITGQVKVSFTIDRNGVVSNPTVVGSPPAPLAAVVLDSILRWKFEPPRRGGEAVSVRATQVFNFNIE
jgi:TonB family protein